MAHFAELDKNNLVLRVIVIDQESINTGDWGNPDNWLQTSYNTRGGQHIHPDTGEIDTKTPLRKNYAGKGYTYDKSKDAFIAPQPYPSWTLDEDSCLWNPPVAHPMDGKGPYHWDEDVRNWVKL
jgi:hypothetical protein